MSDIQFNDAADSTAPQTHPKRRSRFASRALVVFMFGWPITFLLVGVVLSLRKGPPDARTVTSPFKPWDGEWEGELVTFGSDGGEVSRARATQKFRHTPDKKEFHQEGHFDVTDARTGKTELERELKRVDFDMKTMRRKVIRKNGNDVALYAGEIKDGKIVWSRHGPGYQEEFTEGVDGDTYLVRGKGIYGHPPQAEELTYEGEYRRVRKSE